MKLSTKQRHYLTVEKALIFIQQQQQQNQQPKLSMVARHCAISEHHLQRTFRQWAGVSPKQFLQHLNREHARSRLLSGDSLLQTSEVLGLSSSSRLHDLFVSLEAITPGELKSAGEGLTFNYGVHPSPFGQIFIATTARGIHRLDFINGSDINKPLKQLQQQWPKAEFIQANTEKIVDTIFMRGHQPLKFSLWLQGSTFQFKVWEALLKIPSGAVCSYGDLAAVIGQPSAARAVGSAVGKNSIALLIPCHRVIQAMGAIGNYRWGEIRKQALLGWEASQVRPVVKPK